MNLLGVIEMIDKEKIPNDEYRQCGDCIHRYLIYEGTSYEKTPCSSCEQEAPTCFEEE